jgi:hypothetical protein
VIVNFADFLARTGAIFSISKVGFRTKTEESREMMIYIYIAYAFNFCWLYLLSISSVKKNQDFQLFFNMN